jgi:hypothetical protein
MRLLSKKLVRAATIAAAIVASSSSLATGRPLANLGDLAFKLTAGFSEVEEVRRRISSAHAQTRDPLKASLSLHRDGDRQAVGPQRCRGPAAG